MPYQDPQARGDIFHINNMKSQQAYGTFLVVAASMTFALIALIVKSDPLPATLAAEVRFFISWLMSVAFMLRYQKESGLSWFGPAKIRCSLILRGFLICGFVTLWWAALPMAPLGDCIAVVYCGPLLTVVLSRFMFGEKVLPVFPIQAFLAMAGMCFIIQPPMLLSALGMVPASDSGGGHYFLVIAAMIVSALIPLATYSTKEANWIEVEHVTNFLAVFVLNPLVFCFQNAAAGETFLELPPIGAWEVGLIVMAALGSFAGVAMQTRGFQMADPGRASMFTYLEIPFAYLIQVLATNNAVSQSSIIGAFLVLLSCLLGVVAELRSSNSRDVTAVEELLLKEQFREDSKEDLVLGA